MVIDIVSNRTNQTLRSFRRDDLSSAPQKGDLVKIGGRDLTVQGRAWDFEDNDIRATDDVVSTGGTVLTVYVG